MTLTASHDDSPALPTKIRAGDILALAQDDNTVRLPPPLPVSPSKPDDAWSPPPAADVARWLPQWRIDALLGAGGMAAVYRGWQAGLSRHVAVKLMRPDLLSEAARERFRREGLALARLRHAHLVSAIDAGVVELPPQDQAKVCSPTDTIRGSHSDLAYLVMEFVDGPSLAERLGKGPLSPSEVLNVGIGVAEALAEAHRLGILHRDIKPGNILLDATGKPWLTDFGIALWTEGVTPAPNTFLELRTRTGVVAGTPGYVAPELVMGISRATVASDIYSLGRTLERALLGQGITCGSTLSLVPTDPRYELLISIACHPDPARRHPSAETLIADLRVLRDTTPTTPLPFVQRAVRPPALPTQTNQTPPPLPAASMPTQPKVPRHERSAMPEPSANGLHRHWMWRALASLPWRWLGRRTINLLQLRPVQMALTFTAIVWWLWPDQEDREATLLSANAASPYWNHHGMAFVHVPKTRLLIATKRTTRGVYRLFALQQAGLEAGWERSAFASDDPTPTDADPVLYVSHHDAELFCQWLTRTEAQHTGHPLRYRLPTTAEWRAAFGPSGAEGIHAQLARHGEDAAQRSPIDPTYLAELRYREHRLPRSGTNLLGLRQLSAVEYEWVDDPVTGQSVVIWGESSDPLGRTLTFNAGFRDDALRGDPPATIKVEGQPIVINPGFYFRCVIDLDAPP